MNSHIKERGKLTKEYGPVPDDIWDKICAKGPDGYTGAYEDEAEEFIDYIEGWYAFAVELMTFESGNAVKDTSLGHNVYKKCVDGHVRIFEDVERIRKSLGIIRVFEDCGCSVRDQIADSWNRRHPRNQVSGEGLKAIPVTVGNDVDYLWDQITDFWNLANPSEQLCPDALRRKYQRAREDAFDSAVKWFLQQRPNGKGLQMLTRLEEWRKRYGLDTYRKLLRRLSLEPGVFCDNPPLDDKPHADESFADQKARVLRRIEEDPILQPLVKDHGIEEVFRYAYALRSIGVMYPWKYERGRPSGKDAACQPG